MSAALEQFLARAEALLARVEAILPPAAPQPEWARGYAFRWRQRANGPSYLQAVAHVSHIALDDLQHIGPQKEQIELRAYQFAYPTALLGIQLLQS